MPLNKTRTYLTRQIDSKLSAWGDEKNRKPLLLRGARQVGKSYSVRNFARKFEHFIEINFEEKPEAAELFSGNLTPSHICENISIYSGKPVIPGKTLLFLDEIQQCIPAISSLRFFYEQMPDLHLIAAGSLLEFALEEIPSFGVGRIRSLFMYPFSFDEFLLSVNEHDLLHLKKNASAEKPIPQIFHNKLIEYFKKFLITGGMPEVVSEFINKKEAAEIQMPLDDLLISFRNDFAKYRKRVASSLLLEVFEAVARQTGGKFVYRKAVTDIHIKQIKEAVELLVMAGLVLPATHSDANGIPLGAEVNHKKRKLFLLDSGLHQRIAGLNLSDVILNKDFNSINKGSLSELFVATEIVKYSDPFRQNNLYYWQREVSGSNAEIDFLAQDGEYIVPIEVKSSGSGSMQSMYAFLKEKKQPYGVRFSFENFSEVNNIRIFPIYAVSNFTNRIS